MTKVSPFRYPKSKHVRRFTPKPRRTYRSYKSILRDEFYHRCVYCTLPDLLKGKECFGADHYRPQKEFPSLVTEYTNLFYACNVCNSRKRDFWPSLDQLNAGRYVPNPCDHVMYDHMHTVGAEVKARSNTGEFALELLDLNDPETLRYRDLVIDLCRSMRNEVNGMKETSQELLARISVCMDDAKKQELERWRAALEVDLQRISNRLKELLN